MSLTGLITKILRGRYALETQWQVIIFEVIEIMPKQFWSDTHKSSSALQMGLYHKVNTTFHKMVL